MSACRATSEAGDLEWISGSNLPRSARLNLPGSFLWPPASLPGAIFFITAWVMALNNTRQDADNGSDITTQQSLCLWRHPIEHYLLDHSGRGQPSISSRRVFHVAVAFFMALCVASGAANRAARGARH